VNDLEMSQLMSVTRKRAKVSKWLSSNLFLLKSLFHSFKHLLFCFNLFVWLRCMVHIEGGQRTQGYEMLRYNTSPGRCCI